MPLHTIIPIAGVFIALGLVDPSTANAQASLSNQDPSNCAKTDNRLPKDWSCSSNRNCISLDNAGAVICCPPAYGCAKMAQQPCDRSDPFWTDRVRTYGDKDARISCKSGLCCPMGYQCIDALPREAGYCVLNWATAVYPTGLDPDDWQNCSNDCNRYDVCCPDQCEGLPCTKTATVEFIWASISPAQLTLGSAFSETPTSSASRSTSSKASTTGRSSPSRPTPSSEQSQSSSTSAIQRTPRSSASASPSSSDQGSSDSSINGAIIAGALVGGLLLLCALLGIVFWLRKRQRSKQAISPGHHTQQIPGGQHGPGQMHQATAFSRSRSMRSPDRSIASPTLTAITGTTAVSPLYSRTSCQENPEQSTPQVRGVMYPFIREDDYEPMSPVSPTTAAASATVTEADRGVPLSREGDSRDAHDENVHDECEEGLMSVDDGTLRRSDPNGSEAYEMERWGKPIKQTNVS